MSKKSIYICCYVFTITLIVHTAIHGLYANMAILIFLDFCLFYKSMRFMSEKGPVKMWEPHNDKL